MLKLGGAFRLELVGRKNGEKQGRPGNTYNVNDVMRHEVDIVYVRGDGLCLKLPNSPY